MTSRFLCDFQFNEITGSQGASVLASALENRFRKYPNGFYKFMEPCGHRLYRKGDSLCEEIGASRKKITRDFQKIGVSYHSRTAFENAADKFQGKMYARYYERTSHLTYFIRNHELADRLLKGRSKRRPQRRSSRVQCDRQDHHTLDTSSQGSDPSQTLESSRFGNGQEDRSYISYKTSWELSKDNSQGTHRILDHNNNKHSVPTIAQQMGEIWSSTVGQPLVALTPKRIAFLKKAFVDQFQSCLKQWEAFCQRVASSKFLMGEIKSSFKATLDWVLKFEVIQKIREGAYGVGGRSCATQIDHGDLESHITNLDEPEEAKQFRRSCLKRMGSNTYVSWLKGLTIDLEGKTLKITAPTGFVADYISQAFYTDLRLVLEAEESVSCLEIFADRESRTRSRPRLSLHANKRPTHLNRSYRPLMSQCLPDTEVTTPISSIESSFSRLLMSGCEPVPVGIDKRGRRL